MPDATKVKFTILKDEKRPVSATADYFEVRNVKNVEIEVDKNQFYQILFDPNHSLEERIIKEQFV